MTHPLVSVVITLYNKEKYVEKCVLSVLNQDYKDFEVIIIDDKSTDKSYSLLNKISKDERIRKLQNYENLGVSKTRNKGIELSKGSLLAFLDADDFWEPTFISSLVHLINKTDSDISYCGYNLVHENEEIERTIKFRNNLTLDDILKNRSLGIGTSIIKKELILDIYFKEYPISEDYLYWIDVFSKNHKTKTVGTSKALLNYRMVPNSRSGSSLKAIYGQWTILKNESNLSLIKASYYFVYYILSIVKWKLRINP